MSEKVGIKKETVRWSSAGVETLTTVQFLTSHHTTFWPPYIGGGSYYGGVELDPPVTFQPSRVVKDYETLELILNNFKAYCPFSAERITKIVNIILMY